MDNGMQQFWYEVQYDGNSEDGNSIKFGYLTQQGKTIASIWGFEIVGDGKWEEVDLGVPHGEPMTSDPVITPFGENGAKVTISWTLSLIPFDYELNLVFETVVDFMNQLPLDKFSAKDSSFIESTDGPDNTKTHAVRALKPLIQASGDNAGANTVMIL